jgi:CDP-diacylglycerol pyrophosphatase
MHLARNQEITMFLSRGMSKYSSALCLHFVCVVVVVVQESHENAPNRRMYTRWFQLHHGLIHHKLVTRALSLEEEDDDDGG